MRQTSKLLKIHILKAILQQLALPCHIEWPRSHSDTVKACKKKDLILTKEKMTEDKMDTGDYL